MLKKTHTPQHFLVCAPAAHCPLFPWFSLCLEPKEHAPPALHPTGQQVKWPPSLPDTRTPERPPSRVHPGGPAGRALRRRPPRRGGCGPAQVWGPQPARGATENTPPPAAPVPGRSGCTHLPGRAPGGAHTCPAALAAAAPARPPPRTHLARDARDERHLPGPAGLGVPGALGAGAAGLRVCHVPGACGGAGQGGAEAAKPGRGGGGYVGVCPRASSLAPGRGEQPDRIAREARARGGAGARRRAQGGGAGAGPPGWAPRRTSARDTAAAPAAGPAPVRPRSRGAGLGQCAPALGTQPRLRARPWAGRRCWAGPRPPSCAGRSSAAARVLPDRH